MTAAATKPSTWFQRFLLPGFAFKAVVIGGGYATGRELAEFFLPSGPWGGIAGMLLAMVIWSPSRIQAAPRPATIRVWKGLQLNLSRRAGIVERSGTEALAAITIPFGSSPVTRADGRSTSTGWAFATLAPAPRPRHQPIGVKS